MVSRAIPVVLGDVVGSVAAQSGGGSGTAVIGLLVWAILIVGVFLYFRGQRKPFQLQTQTALSPQDAIRTAVQTYSMSGWQVTSQTPDNATFVKNTKGSCLVTGLLLLLGLVPGILYLVFSGRSINAYVYAGHEPGGGSATTTIQVRGTASGWGARAAGQRVVHAVSAPAMGGPGATPSLPRN